MVARPPTSAQGELVPTSVEETFLEAVIMSRLKSVAGVVVVTALAVASLGCTPPNGRYGSDVFLPNATNRTRNYSGTLAETFRCIAELGTDGCGFEQHFAALERGLDGSNPENAGFLRENAGPGAGCDPRATGVLCVRSSSGLEGEPVCQLGWRQGQPWWRLAGTMVAR